MIATSEPTMRLLSLGAGVQSTVLALMAADGTLPGLDGAIFADTGWEPKRVYEHLARLEKVLADSGIPLYRVSNGNLRSDAIDPAHRYASIPYFVLNWAEKRVPVKSTGYTCPDCAGTGWASARRLWDPSNGQAAPTLAEEPTLFDDGPTAGLGYMLSSNAVGLRASEAFDGLDADQRSDLIRWIRSSGEWPVICDACGGEGAQYRERQVVTERVEGMGRRQCTSEYKLAPIGRKVRELLGAKAPDFRTVPRGRVAEQWIGFSTDEIGRVSEKDGVSYIRKRYPLLELGMDRKACERWLRSHGWAEVAKSACIGCPFHGNRQWRDLRDNHPDEWADAVDFDRAIRKGGARGLPLNGEAFLHRSRVPLAVAPIDRRTAVERAEAQLNAFDLVEDGDPDGCSPYGCRSGEPVEVAG